MKMKYFLRIWNSKDLRKRILFTLFVILTFRLAGHITVPGVDPKALSEVFGAGGALSIFSALTGGSMENFSIVMMGLSPYINASIIVQLMTVAIPALERMSKEGGEQGRRQINAITRWLTFPLAFLQSYGMIVLLARSTMGMEGTFLDPKDFSQVFPAMITISAGTIFLVWLGELISEKGIGNGISLLIFTGIVSAMPSVVGNLLVGASLGEAGKVPAFLIFMIVTLALLVVVVVCTEAHRAVPINHTSRNSRGGKSDLPVRFLQAGMIPIIFAISIITFPSILMQFLQNSEKAWVANFSTFWHTHFNSGSPTVEYLALYFLLIVAFSYFYVSITFNPENVAESLQKRGGFIPGVRPGRATAEYLHKVSNRMNLWGGGFLGLIALVPLVFTMFTNLSSSDLIISGSGLIIVVGVVLDLIRQIDSKLVMQDYDKLS